MPTVEAIIKGVVDKETGWSRIETDSRPRFLDTKRPDLVAEARQLMREGVVALITYNESPSQNINPHTQRPYMNVYYEGAIATANGGSRHAPEPTRAAPWDGDGESDTLRNWRIALSVGAKLAVQTLPLMPSEQRDFDTQKQIALAWAMWLVSTPQPASDLDDDIPFGTRSTAELARARMGAYSEPEPQPTSEFGY